MPNLFRQAVALSQRDCFTVLSARKAVADVRPHLHESIELSLIINAAGAKRIINGNEYVTGHIDLAVVGPNVSHGFLKHHCKANDYQEVTLQIQHDLFKSNFFQKNYLISIKQLLDDLNGGIVFSTAIAEEVAARLLSLKKSDNFNAILELLHVFHSLTTDTSQKFFANTAVNMVLNKHEVLSQQVLLFLDRNYAQRLAPENVARKFNISVAVLGNIIKNMTGRTFIGYMNELRLNHVTGMLIDSTCSVSEIAYKCGFVHLCTFNRVFKQSRQCTPSEFRQNYLRLVS